MAIACEMGMDVLDGKKLHEKIRELGDEALLYPVVCDAYAKNAEKLSREEQGQLYKRLRREGAYRVRNEAEAAVYVKKVSERHREKFSELYTSFFNEHASIFSGDLSLVVWGCGVGLDLLAFYDAAMQQKRPELWVRVQQIVLLDIEPWVLDRAQQYAKVLFPTAKVYKQVVDFKSAQLSEVLTQIEVGDVALIPRVHLISNVLDLVVSEREVFFKAFSDFAHKRGKVNEFLLMFSPVYGDLQRVSSEAIEQCLRESVGNVVFESVSKPEPHMWTQYFSYRILDRHWESGAAYDACFSEPLFKDLRKEIQAILSEKTPVFDKTTLGKVFNFVRDNRLAQWYQGVKRIDVDLEEREEDKGKDSQKTTGLLFCPKQDEQGRWYRPLMFFGKNLEKKRYSICSQVFELPYEEGYVHPLKKQTILMHPGNLEKLPYDIGWVYTPDKPEQVFDFESLFFLKANGETLPSLEQLDKKQREVAVSRKQKMKVRGSPGSGKTLAMVWHGVMAYRRTHLPILFLGKTNSLLSINGSRFAAAFNEARIPKDAVTCQTVNDFLCKRFGHGKSCWADTKKCADCNQEALKKINNGEGVKKAYGAVLMDELQLVDPEIVKAVHKATEKANPYREFYLFGDEQQTLHDHDKILEENSEEPQKAKKTKVIKVPRLGFGEWKTLKQSHRFANLRLQEVADFIQRNCLTEAYDVTALAYERKPAQGRRFNQKAFRIMRGDKGQLVDAFKRLHQEEIRKENNKKEAVVIMFASKDLACEFGKKGKNGFPLPPGWEFYTTHPAEDKTGKDAQKNQEARRNFRERDKTLHVTTIDCMQGHTFSKVLFVVNLPLKGEALFTACTRARDILYVLDMTPEGTYYDKLKHFN